MGRKLTMDELQTKMKRAEARAAKLKAEMQKRTAAEQAIERKEICDAAIAWRDAYGWTTADAVKRLQEYAKSAPQASDYEY